MAVGCDWHGHHRDRHCVFCKGIRRDQFLTVAVWGGSAVIMAVLGAVTGVMIAMIVGGAA